MPTYEKLTELSRLPDPSTLLFGVRSGAPAEGEPGRREAVEHWSFHAGRDGYTVTLLGTRSGHGSATYCGDVDVDGLVYQVHRGPRRRIVQAWMDSEGAWQGRFVLEDAIWAVPVPPEPEPNDCPWCAGGPPDTLRLAGSGRVDGIFSVWMAEHADGTRRGIVIQHDSDEGEPDTVCFEPAHSVVEAGLRGWALSDGELALRFTEDTASELEICDADGWMRFRLVVKPAARRRLRAGLEKILQLSS
ncbi:hypothetical protein E1193_07140 [Micromonospora sp. KC606]|uniref:hypothetical protein n=1 Tax=Micromonospora sp. KC606 TaxID=2530379 RepID=UPI00104CE60B|nr:hypothetical protein [Micromonospora sp. KC606]TDC83988.1 hypothetical protein E1193_07140 [Micromonospora sp. KC606]